MKNPTPIFVLPVPRKILFDKYSKSVYDGERVCNFVYSLSITKFKENPNSLFLVNELGDICIEISQDR